MSADPRRVLSDPNSVEKLTAALESSGVYLALGQLLECAARCGVAIVPADATTRWADFTDHDLDTISSSMIGHRSEWSDEEQAVLDEIAFEIKRRTS
jgi:hypothetical protein